MTASPIFTVHPNGTKFIYITSGITIHVNAKPNKDGRTYDGRKAYYVRVQNGQPPGVLIEYPDGVRRFISNSWYECHKHDFVVKDQYWKSCIHCGMIVPVSHPE